MEKVVTTKINWLRIAFLLCLLVSQITSANAQNRVTMQFRPGVSFPTTDLGNADLKIGAGFELLAGYRFMKHVSVYAGWGWNRFTSGESFAGSKTDFEETGYVVGLQFIHPFYEDLPFDYFVKGGAIYNHIEAEDADGKIFADSGHGFGFQVETGWSFSLGESWRIIPGIKYQTLSRSLDVDGVSYSVDMNYLSVGATISRSF
jgi:hypothetical protein